MTTSMSGMFSQPLGMIKHPSRTVCQTLGTLRHPSGGLNQTVGSLNQAVGTAKHPSGTLRETVRKSTKTVGFDVTTYQNRAVTVFLIGTYVVVFFSASCSTEWSALTNGKAPNSAIRATASC